MTGQQATEVVFQNAVKHWWESKNVNAAGIANAQGGSRNQNLRGDTMDGFRDVIIGILLEEGVKREDIFYGSHFAKHPSNLPAYFRASKNWDVIVCKNSLYKTVENPLFATSASEAPTLEPILKPAVLGYGGP